MTKVVSAHPPHSPAVELIEQESHLRSQMGNPNNCLLFKIVSRKWYFDIWYTCILDLILLQLLFVTHIIEKAIRYFEQLTPLVRETEFKLTNQLNLNFLYLGEEIKY